MVFEEEEKKRIKKEKIKEDKLKKKEAQELALKKKQQEIIDKKEAELKEKQDKEKIEVEKKKIRIDNEYKLKEIIKSIPGSENLDKFYYEDFFLRIKNDDFNPIRFTFHREDTVANMMICERKEDQKIESLFPKPQGLRTDHNNIENLNF